MIASVSQIGPREVLTRIALFFISPISRAPTRPRLRGLSTRCTDRMSARRNNLSFSTRSTAPARAEAADGLAGDPVADPGLPAALAHKGVVLGDAPRGAEDEAPGE